MQYMFSRRRGTITVILLGLISVIVVFAFSLSRRLSSHTHLLTVGDHTQIARYYLESYIGDVIRQVARQANDPESDIHPIFRQAGTGDTSISSFKYQANALLAGLQKELDIELVGQPKINIRGQKPLPYPDVVQVPEKLNGLEKRGFLSISCSIMFNKHPYTMAVRAPFLVTMHMTPVLREFVLFCDRIHLEQERPFGDDDRINLTFTKGGEHPKEVPADYSAWKGQPWVLWFTPETMDNKDKCGRVFLGADDKPIYLNLAGEKNFQSGYMCDLWQVFPGWIKINKNNEKFQEQPIFLDTNGKPVSLRGIDVQLKFRNHLAKIGILGFCHEITDDAEDSLFANASRKLTDIMGPDPSFQALVKNSQKSLALASSLKLFGKNAEGSDDKHYYGPAREVFGRVFGRFLMITFFEYPSARGGGQPLPYNPNSDFQPPPFSTFNDVSQVQFTTAEPGQHYGDYMSRVVSGGADSSSAAFATYMCVNPASKQSRQPFTYNDFAPADGLRLKGSFDSFGPAWFAIDPKKRAGDPALSTVQSRISRMFQNQDAFKKAVGDGKSKFRIDGVVYVKGSLSLKDITAADIRGGVVLVEKDITLGNITRGIDFNQADRTLILEVTKKITEMKQEEILTFVSMSGSPIKLMGDKQVGVQLISMNKNLGVPTDQVSWEALKRPIFCGGIAINTPNLRERVREFGKASADPIFLYVPAMADPKPTVAVNIKSYLEGYRLVADEGKGWTL